MLIFFKLEMGHIFFWLLYFKKGSKGGQHPEISYIWRVHKIFFHPILLCFLFCYWMDCMESFWWNVGRFPLALTVFEIKLNERGRKVFILMGYWWAIKMLFYFEKWSRRDQISKFMYNWKLYRFCIFHPILMGIFCCWMDCVKCFPQ